MQKQPRLGGNARLSRWDTQVSRKQPMSALSQSLAKERIESTGRKREGQGRQEPPFTEVRRRKKQGALQKGSSTIEAEGGMKPPVSVFLSGTSTDCTEEVVREKLILCAAAIGDQNQAGVALEILKIEHIPLKIPQGEVQRCRCWKVTVPPQFAEHMEKSAAYPAVWGWRKWNRGPQVKQGVGATDGRA